MQQIFPIILFVGGILGGLYASNVGGGALISFPLLVLTGLPTHSVIATQRFAAVILELVSAARFYKEKQINLKIGVMLGLIAACGSVIGSKIVLAVSERFLNLVVGVLFLIVFVVLFNKDRIGIKEKPLTHKNLALASVATFLLAIYGGFFGAGFGFFIIVVLVLLGFTFIKSAAIGRVVGFFMSAASAIVFARSGLINYQYGIALGAGFAIGSWVGIGIAMKRGDKYIKSLLIIIMILSLVKLLSGVFNFNVF